MLRVGGIDARRKSVQEAAVKFFTFGAVCGAVMLFGFPFLYGVSGSLDLAAMRPTLISAPAFVVAFGFGLLRALIAR